MRAMTETADDDLEPSIINLFHMFGERKENKQVGGAEREPDGTGGGRARHLSDDPLDGADGELDAEERLVTLKAQNRICSKRSRKKTKNEKSL